MYSWKPTDDSMPGHTLPIIPDDVNPEAEGVPQRTATQERKRRKRQRYRKNKRLRKAAEVTDEVATDEPSSIPSDDDGPRSCIICMEEFAQDDGPSGNFWADRKRAGSCKCTRDYDYCNSCFIRNFRRNSVTCQDEGCPCRNMTCPTCNMQFGVTPALVDWCRSNYYIVDAIEEALKVSGGF